MADQRPDDPGAPRPEDERPADETPFMDVPEEVDPDAVVEEAPRRAASAEFVVEGEVASAAIMREAMDPANQSLREALRLSYRVLQVVIAALIVVFVFSGFNQVASTQSGVMLRFGRIVGEPGNEALAPGAAFNIAPYPAGEFVIFRDQNIEVDVGRPFWPDVDGEFDEAVDRAVSNRVIPPGPNSEGRGDGYLLTADGSIAHAKFRATYGIDSPVAYVNRLMVQRPDELISPADGDRLVRLSVMRAAVHTAASLDLDTFVDFTDQERDDIRRNAQQLLDGLETGIRITDLTTPIEPTPALAVVKAQREYQGTIREVDRTLEQARQQAEARLIEVAGERYQEFLDVVEDYRAADLAGDLDGMAAAITAFDEKLETEGLAGEIATVIERARSHQSFIESTLGQQYQQFLGLRESYRRSPELVISRQWTETLERVFSRPDTELVMLPRGIGRYAIGLESSDEVATTRRDLELNRKQAEAASIIGTLQGVRDRGMRDASEMGTTENRRRLNADATGDGGGE